MVLDVLPSVDELHILRCLHTLCAFRCTPLYFPRPKNLCAAHSAAESVKHVKARLLEKQDEVISELSNHLEETRLELQNVCRGHGGYPREKTRILTEVKEKLDEVTEVLRQLKVKIFKFSYGV